ncbi:histidine kinase [bacterium AH-315-C07]|nr:histidine kinase [bacterium AH-315-C07]
MNYSVERGLPQSQVKDIFQDSKGFIWVGTLGGVCRFDGSEFEQFSTQTGLLDNQVNKIYEDNNKNIWVATIEGISLLQNGRFISYPLSFNGKILNVRDILEVGDNNLMLATEWGLYRFNLENNRLDSSPIGLAGKQVRSLCMDANNLLWIGSRSGLYNLKNGEIIEADSELSGEFNISDITTDLRGDIWVSTFGDGLFRFNGTQIENFTMGDGLSTNWIRGIINHNGDLWVCSKKGVNKINYTTTPVIIENYESSNGMPTANINILFSDNEKNLWLGSDGKGLLKFVGESFINFTTKDGLSGDIVMSLLEDDNKDLWFSTYGKGISRFDGKTYRNYSIKDGLSNNTVWASLKDSKGNLWFGTSNGINRFRNGVFTRFNDQKGLNGNKITSLFEADNKIWCGSKDGIYVYDGEGFEKVFVGDIEIKNVRKIFKDHSGDLWFATSTGLLHKNGNKYELITTKDGLPSNTIYSIIEDLHGNLWLGTKSGLAIYSSEEIKPIRVSTNFSSNFINFLQYDLSDKLWIGTNNGIYTLDVERYYENQNLDFIHYTNWEGLNSLECNLNSSYQDSEGNLWFGTSAGIVKHNPNQITKNTSFQEPYIHLSSIDLFKECTNWSNYSEIEVASGLPMNLDLTYDLNHLTFNFKGISHTNPLDVKYKYILQGFDKDWSPSLTGQVATYSNIPPGDYTFKVIASNKQGLWTSNPAEFSFTIKNPFWMTWWFYLLSFLVFCGTCYLIYLWRNGVVKRKMETQRLVHRSKMLVLEQKALNASMNRHFIFNALNSIQYYINKQDKRSANNYLSRFAKLIRKNLDDSNANLVSLADELDRLELYLSLEHMRFNDKFKYEINVDDDIDKEEIQIPFMLLQPFVENSIWHGILPKEEKGSVHVNVTRNENGEVVFEIKDDGIGIDKSMKDKANSTQLHESKGMKLTKNRIDLLREMTNKNVRINGPVELKDHENNPAGTKVEIVWQPN